MQLCGSLSILWHCLSFFGIGMKTDLFQSCGHCWVFQICWHIECSSFTASSFRIWNSSTGIPSPPLALFVVMLSFFFFNFYLYNIILVLPYINTNLPQLYTCSPSWTLLPPPSPYHLSGSSQCTSPKHPVSCIEPGLVTSFIYDILHVSMPFFQIIPPSPSPTESKRLFCTLRLFCCLAYRVIITIFLNSIYMR